MTADPSLDQARARARDQRRFLELVTPYLAGPGINALDRMPAEQAAEVRELLDRLGLIGEDPAITAARQEELLRLAELEYIVYEVLARPHYKTSPEGKILANPETGEYVPDDKPAREARQLLAEIEASRNRLAGIPEHDDSDHGTSD